MQQPPPPPPPSHAAACVGPDSAEAGKASSCEGCPNQSSCASGANRAPAEPTEDEVKVASAMARVRHRVLVLSGKGGVGKSTFSTQLAYGLARKGLRVGLLDVDICGPSIPTMLGLRGREVHQSASGWSPVYVDVVPAAVNGGGAPAPTMTTTTTEGAEEADAAEGELSVMSIGFLLPDQDAAVIWRGPRKTGLLTQFFGSVDWGELDYLVVDTPPGTSDEHISIVQLLKKHLNPQTDGAVVVTTPQEVAMADVRKELSFCKQTGIRVIGVAENMAPLSVPLSGLRFLHAPANDKAPKAGEEDVTAAFLKAVSERLPEFANVKVSVDVFPRPPNGGGPAGMASKFGVPFLGSVPLDPQLQRACDDGTPLPLCASLGALRHVVNEVIRATEPDVVDVARKRRQAAALAAQQSGAVGKVVVTSSSLR